MVSTAKPYIIPGMMGVSGPLRPVPAPGMRTGGPMPPEQRMPPPMSTQLPPQAQGAPQGVPFQSGRTLPQRPTGQMMTPRRMGPTGLPAQMKMPTGRPGEMKLPRVG